MRIATLTYHRALNYGAVLQAYALQTAIRNKYPDVEIGVLDYRNNKIEANRKLFRFSNNKRLKQNLYLHQYVQRKLDLLMRFYIKILISFLKSERL